MFKRSFMTTQIGYMVILFLMLNVSFSSSETIDRIIAKVGSSSITYQQTLRFLEKNLIWRNIQGEKITEKSISYLPEIFQELIQRRVIDEIVKVENIKVSNTEILNSMKYFAQKNGFSLIDFVKTVERNIKNFRNFLEISIKYELLKGKIYQKILEKNTPNISEEKIDELINQAEFHPYLYKLQYITKNKNKILDTEKSLRNKRTTLKEVVNSLRKGVDFRQLAMRHSETFKSETDFLPAKELPKVFKDSLSQLAVNVFAIEESEKKITLYGVSKIKTINNNYITEYNLRKIEMPLNSLVGHQTTKEKINEIYNIVIKDPSQFSELAKTWSEDIQSAISEGETGWLTQSNIPENIINVLKETPLKGITKPIAYEDTIYIFQLIEKRSKNTFLETYRKNIEAQLKQKNIETTFSIFLTKETEKHLLWVDPTVVQQQRSVQ